MILCASAGLATTPPQPPAPVSPPVWAKADNFWYRKAVPGGYVWLNVDALHGVKEPLFDHQRLAIELTIRTGVEYTPLTLPFVDPASRFVVKYDGSNAYVQEGAMAVEFVHGSDYWRCDLQTKWNWNKVPPTDYECLKSPAPASTSRAALSTVAQSATVETVASPDGGWEALIQNHNVAVKRAGTAAAGTVLSTDGSAAEAYQLGSIQWSADSRTLSAYRVGEAIWQSDGVTGSVKKHIVKAQWTVTSDR
jgi:hypothetical protein